jgi:hypothetical protein
MSAGQPDRRNGCKIAGPATHNWAISVPIAATGMLPAGAHNRQGMAHGGAGWLLEMGSSGACRGAASSNLRIGSVPRALRAGSA